MLTQFNHSAILRSLSQKTKAGIGTPFKSRRESAVTGVFLCLSFSAAFVRVHSVLAGLFGQPSRLAVPRYGSSNPLKPVAQSLEPLCGGYSLFLGVTV